MANDRRRNRRHQAFPDFLGPGGLVTSRDCELHTLHVIGEFASCKSESETDTSKAPQIDLLMEYIAKKEDRSKHCKNCGEGGHE